MSLLFCEDDAGLVVVVASWCASRSMRRAAKVCMCLEVYIIYTEESRRGLFCFDA